VSSDSSQQATAALMNELFSVLSRQTALGQLPFNPGCSEAVIERAQQSLGVKLPEDYKTFLGSHNGQTDPYTLTFPPDQIVFLSIEDVVALWNEVAPYRDDQFYEELEAEEQIRSVLYHPRRVPIAHNESGGAYLFLDYIPGPKGRECQLIFNVNEVDLVLIAKSFTELMKTYLTLLETGRATVKRRPPDYGDGHWFESSEGEYINWSVYKRLLGVL
jgi:cell wall assembly regulator SMI1